MTIPFNSLAPEVARIRPEIDAAVARVLDRGWFIHGPENEAFEKKLGAFYGMPHALGVASGTDAIQVALLALGIGPGDEVIVPALTAAPTALAVLRTGAQPVFADVDPVTLTLDPARLDECLSSHTRAIIPVHLYGLPADIKAIMAFARQHKLLVLEDCAQSHGATVDGRSAGMLGDITAISFYPTKNLGAYGDGGAIMAADADLALKARQIANLGQTARYEHVYSTGINSRLDEIQAAILQVLLDHLPENNALRRERAEWYDELLAGAPGITLPVEPEGRGHVYHLYVIRHPKRDGLREHLKSKGIGSDVHYPKSLTDQKAFADCRAGKGGVPVTERAVDEILSLPMYPHLTQAEVERVCEAVKEFK
jgi:dTDP-4-amino-4,6-dideoxygalactose transaminase